MKKGDLNKRAIAASARAFKAWLHDQDETPLTVFIAQAFRAGYRLGRKVERQEWHEAAGVGGSDVYSEFDRRMREKKK